MAILHNDQEREGLYAFAAKMLREKNVEQLLDVACANGEGTALLLRENFKMVTGVDINKDDIVDAVKNFGNQRMRFVCDDARNMSFQDASFDGIISLHTLEHFNAEDQARFLSELKRVLRPNGWLVIATPDVSVWKLQGIAGQQEDHIKELERHEAAELLHEQGFLLVGTYGQHVLRQGSFALRKLLNVLKHLDVFRLRKIFLGNSLDKIDSATQPVRIDEQVVPLGSLERASVNVFLCRRKG
jgi:SAM-dependent methyltransferase